MNKKQRTASMLVAIVFLMQLLLSVTVSAEGIVSSQVFSDINGHWAEKTILSMANKGYIKGYTAYNGYIVKPDSNITRAEFLTVLIKTKNLSVVKEKVKSFIDVKEGDWFKQTVDIISGNDIANGYPDNSFKPNSPITRAEISTLLVKISSWKESEIKKGLEEFKDVIKESWYYNSVMICKSKEIINGYQDKTFKPDSFASRAEAFTMVSNYLDKLSVSEPTEKIPGADLKTTPTTVPGTSTPTNTPTYTPTSTPNSNVSSGGSAGNVPQNTTPPTITWADDSDMLCKPGESVTLEVYAEDWNGKSLTNIVWNVTGGEIESNLNTAIWTLPDEEGLYSVVASVYDSNRLYSSVSKNINIVENIFEELQADRLLKIDTTLNPDEDEDNDKLKNSAEIIYGTNPYSADTDKDYIGDAYEINLGTNPLKSDTDEDGILDGYELKLGLNPLSSDSDNDGKSDKENQYSINVKNEIDSVTAVVYGSASAVATTVIENFENEYVSNSYGVLGSVIDIHSKTPIEKAYLTFKYDYSELQKEALTENELCVFWLDEQNKQLVTLPSVVDSVYKTVSAELSHFSKYLIGDKTKILTDLGKTEIVFVIDSSGSMLDNDPDDKRIDVVQSSIRSFDGDYKFAVVDFASSAYTIHGLSSDKDSLINEVDTLRGTQSGGTDIAEAISHAVGIFSGDKVRKVIIFLTDGQDSNASGIKSAVNSAIAQNVQIFAIGLGSGVNSSMLKNSIATPTGGIYLFADDITLLDTYFTSIGSKINISASENVWRKDSNETITGNVLGDSGFKVDDDGYSFSNFSSKVSSGGLCHGFSSTSSLYYNGILPYSKEKKGSGENLQPEYNLNNVKHFKDKKDLNDFVIDELKDYSAHYNFESNIKDKTYVNLKAEEKQWYIDRGYTISTYSKESNGVTYIYEDPILDLNSENFKNGTHWSSEEREVVYAIHWWLNSQSSLWDRKDFSIEKLVNELKKGKTALISMRGKGVGHSVVATKVLQDTKDPSIHWIIIYDNNYPNIQKTIKVTKKVSTYVWGLISSVDYDYESDYSWAEKFYLYEMNK